MSDRSLIGKAVQELETPVFLVDLAAVERNIARANLVFKTAGVNWRPHAKGHKIPAIAHMEIEGGAIGVCCAKLEEAEAMVQNGVRSILITSQVVGKNRVDRLAELCKQAEVITSVDSVENVTELDAIAQQKGIVIPVVVEIDSGLGRAGVQPGEPAVQLARTVQGFPGLRFMGLMTWEGHVRQHRNPEQRRVASEQAVRLVTETAEMCRKAGIPVEIVSCGGTGTGEFSCRVPGVTEIQSGGIVFNDMYFAGLGVDYEFAATVLSTVISRPTPTRIVTDAGISAMYTDRAAPVPKGMKGVKSVSFSAEHGKIELEEPNTDLKVGDKLEWIVGFVDYTIFLHEFVYGVRDGRVETVWPVLARTARQ